MRTQSWGAAGTEQTDRQVTHAAHRSNNPSAPKPPNLRVPATLTTLQARQGEQRASQSETATETWAMRLSGLAALLLALAATSAATANDSDWPTLHLATRRLNTRREHER